VNGRTVADPDRVSRKVSSWNVAGSLAPSDGGDDDGDDDDRANCRSGKLRGPVTAVDGDKFAVMGTWVTQAPTPMMNVTMEIEVGDRLDVRVYRNDEDVLVAYDIKEWHSDFEQVHGRIQRADIGDAGVIRLLILDTLVIVTRDPSVTP
jgi:hypothetical protein